MAEKKGSLMGTALKKCRVHGRPLMKMMLFQLLLRLLALLPAFLAIMGIGKETPLRWILWSLTACLYVFLVMPFRFHAGERLRCFAGENIPLPDGRTPYGLWLKKGVLRLLRGLPFGVPLYGVMGYLVIGSAVLPYNQMWRPVQNLSLIFGMEPTLLNGIVSALPFLLLMLLLLCLGWLRDMPMEYMRSGEIKKAGIAPMLKNFAVNSLLLLPALAGGLAVAIPYIFAHVDFSGNLLKTVRDMSKLMDQPLPWQILAILLGIFLIVYLPLCALRKMRNAVLTDSLLGGSHAAG